MILLLRDMVEEWKALLAVLLLVVMRDRKRGRTKEFMDVGERTPIDEKSKSERHGGSS